MKHKKLGSFAINELELSWNGQILSTINIYRVV